MSTKTRDVKRVKIQTLTPLFKKEDKCLHMKIKADQKV